MFQKMIPIAFLYLKTTYSSRTTLIFSLLMPLLFTFVLGQAMEAGFSADGTLESWPLAVVDQDQSAWSANLVQRLEADSTLDVRLTSLEQALAEIKDQAMSAALIIPAGFGAALEAGQTAELEFRQSAEEIAQAQILLEAVNAARAELVGSLAAADLSVQVAEAVGLLDGATDAQRQAYFARALEDAESQWTVGNPVRVEAEAVTRLETRASIPIGASQSSPGMLVMYALFFTFGGGSSLLVERDEGTLRRLLVMPMSKATIMAGKLLGIFLGALVQMAIMILAGQFLFGVQWGQAPLALALMLVAYGFAGTALGLMVAALARTAAQVNAMGTISIMALASLGGAWWPIEIVPPWMQQLALALPTGWAMRGFHDIVTRGLDVDAVLLEAGVLAGFGLLFLGVGIARFRYE